MATIYCILTGKINYRKENVTEKSIRKRKCIYSSVCILKKKPMYGQEDRDGGSCQVAPQPGSTGQPPHVPGGAPPACGHCQLQPLTNVPASRKLP